MFCTKLPSVKYIRESMNHKGHLTKRIQSQVTHTVICVSYKVKQSIVQVENISRLLLVKE